MINRLRAYLCRSLLAAGFVAAFSPLACAQLSTIDKGHQLLMNNGLQIWGLDQGAVGFNYNNLANANFNGVIWSFGIDEDNSKLSSMSAGQKWGKWVDANSVPANALDAYETSRIGDMVAIQVGDEQQSDLENPNGHTKAWFQAAHAANLYPNQLLYVNSFFIGSDAAYATFIQDANPDAISFDSYPFDSPYGSIIFPHNWLSKAGQFRRHALASYIGLGSIAPRPYGMYLQTYQSTSEGTRHPSDLEMRWQQFTAWTMGYTFVDAFTVGGSSSLFSGSNMSSPTEPRYSQFKESARQSLNLGPALTRLISYGYGPSIVVGKDSSGNNNIVPSDWLVFNKTNAPASQQYLSSVSAANIGTKNNGQPGDVYIGFFNPLHTSVGNTAGTTYFMVTNALGPYLDDPTALVADARQEITLNFDFGNSGITQLLRMSRETGQVEFVPLGHISGSLYSVTLTLDGGTGDLLKYDDGQTFVGAGGTGRPPITPNLYWDADANAAGNNTTTGAGLGGTGTWSASNRWYNGAANGGWANNNHAIFSGTGGTVTLAGDQSAFSLSFKSNGYNLTGSTLTLYGPSVNVDPGNTATINSVIAGGAGIDKSGDGTLILANINNTYNGPTRISDGVLRVSSDGSMGKAPTSLATSIAIDGGTLQYDGNTTIHANRGILVGATGGTIDVTSGHEVVYTQANGISGGNLTKTGAGTVFMNTPSGALNNGWTGNLILKDGTWKISERGGLPFNPPTGASDPIIAGQITFDGGTLQIAGAIPNVTNGRRGITVASGGGTFDTQGFTFNWAGPLAGSDPSAVLTKVGNGTLQLNSNSVTSVPGGSATYVGTLKVMQGTLVINRNTANEAMGPLASISLSNNTGVALTISGSNATSIGSLSGGGTAGGTVMLNAGLVTGNNNTSTQFSGVISGAGGLTKNGSGTFTLAPPAAGNSYSGLNTILGGTLSGNTIANQGTTAAANSAFGRGNFAIANGAKLEYTGVSNSSNRTISLGTGGGEVAVTEAATTLTINGAVSGVGGLTKSGPGTLDLSAVSTFGGGTTINGGTLLVNNLTGGSGVGGGNVTVNSGGTLGGRGAVGTAGDTANITANAGGRIAPGNSPGALTVHGNVTFESGSFFDIEIGGLTSGTEYDRLTINGAANLDGMLNVTLINSFVPSVGNSFTILSATGGLGSTEFFDESLPELPAGLGWDVAYNLNSVVLTTVYDGDYTDDGVVDAADYVLWRHKIGVEEAYDAWTANFGEETGGGSAAVPEPHTWLLLGMSGVMLLSGRLPLAILTQRFAARK